MDDSNDGWLQDHATRSVPMDSRWLELPVCYVSRLKTPFSLNPSMLRPTGNALLAGGPLSPSDLARLCAPKGRPPTRGACVASPAPDRGTFRHSTATICRESVGPPTGRKRNELAPLHDAQANPNWKFQ